MPVDPMIASGGTPVQLANPLDLAAKTLSIKNLALQGRMGEQQYQTLMQNEQDKEATRQALMASGGDLRRAEGFLLQRGLQGPALAIRKSRAEEEKSLVEMVSKKAESRLKAAQFFRDQLPGVGDPQTYSAWREAAMKLVPEWGPGLPAPEQFTPDLPQRLMMTADKALQQPKQSTIQLMIQERDRLAPDDPRRTIYDEAIKKASTHPEPVNVYTGGLTAGVDASGKPVFIQPSTRAGVAPRVVPGVSPPSQASKPLPPAALKLQQDTLEAIGLHKSISADMGALKTQVETGKIDLGPVKNFLSGARNIAGLSDEQSRNYASFVATLEKLRNDSLRLNKGTQTEGDAVRAWRELFIHITDKKFVLQRLEEIKRINERGATLRKLDIDTIRRNFGHEPLDFSKYEKIPPAVGGGAGGGWSIEPAGE